MSLGRMNCISWSVLDMYDFRTMNRTLLEIPLHKLFIHKFFICLVSESTTVEREA